MRSVNFRGEAQQAENPRRASGPIDPRRRQLFQHGNRAFAAAKTHSIRYLAAWNDRALTRQCSLVPEINRLARLRPRRATDQPASVGDQPILARSNEQVVSEMCHICDNYSDFF